MIEIRIESRFTCDGCGKQDVLTNQWSCLPDMNEPADVPDGWANTRGFTDGKPLLFCFKCKKRADRKDKK